MIKFLLLPLLGNLLLLNNGQSSVYAFDYKIDNAGSITLTDQQTEITEIKTIFKNDYINVELTDIEWSLNEDDNDADDNIITWITSVNGKVQDQGIYNLTDVMRELPTSIPVGTIQVKDRGNANIIVTLTLDENESVTEDSFEVYSAGVAIIPLLVILLFAMTTQMVELSLFAGIFVGGCIVSGTVKDGFKDTLSTYILDALIDEYQVMVILFTLFLSGLVGMMQKSGGMIGFTHAISKIATTPRLGQLACFLVGIFVFFDDYANVLLAGETMRPLLDILSISREKLSFIVDATSAPIASISPISSWVGFEVGLIQAEIDKIIEREGTEDIGIKTSGFGVFLQSIKYRYYPIFMIVLMMLLIYSDRDFGTMLIAERKTRVYNRKDGGDGKGKASELDGSKENQPKPGTPLKPWNMFIPVLVLIALIFYLLVETGTDDSIDQSFLDKIEASDSFVALLWGTMGAAIITILLYSVQITKDGKLVLPTPDIIKEWLCSARNSNEEEDGADESSRARSLMSVLDSIEGFLFGMGRIFPALIVLTLAWASGSMMEAVGADRLFSAWIVGGVEAENLPTLSFIISFFMALATGTSWGTMSILFPLITVPTYVTSNGDELIFYSTIAGVLSGSVAGDHMSPISDTTVLSALACDCRLLAHVSTQAPYVMFVVLLSLLLGTIPIGHSAWPNIIGYLIGWLILGLFVYFICKPVVDEQGSFDIFTELYLKVKGPTSNLGKLKDDTIKKFYEDDNTTDANKNDPSETHRETTEVGEHHVNDDKSGKISYVGDELMA